MKKGLCACVLVLLAVNGSVWAQTGVRFGFRAGYSMATQYGIDDPTLPYDLETSYRHGLAGGFFVYYPITDAFGIQQEFLYVQKGSKQDITMLEAPVETNTNYKINYFELPILFRYSFLRLGKARIYGCTGFALSIMTDGDYRTKGSIEIQGMPITFEDSGKIEGVDIFDYAFLYGNGVDFPLFDRECFFEYRFTIGWNSLMMPTFEGEPPVPLRNQDYIFSLGMYF